MTPDTTHGNTEEGSDGQELLECVAETRGELEYANEDQVAHESPLSTVSVSDDTEDKSAERPEEKGKRDSGSDLSGDNIEGRGQPGNGKRHGEEVVSVASPREPTAKTSALLPASGQATLPCRGVSVAGD